MAEGNERLESLINSKNWKNLITFCEDYEIEVAPFESEGKKPFHGTLLLAYLIVGDLYVNNTSLGQFNNLINIK